MDDRIAEIREAFERVGRSPGEIGTVEAILGGPEDLNMILEAARAYVDLFDSDALIIRDEIDYEAAWAVMCAAGCQPIEALGVFDAWGKTLAKRFPDALIIRRDETGEWPEAVTSRIHLYDAHGSELSGALILDYVENALASSQGVEPQ